MTGSRESTQPTDAKRAIRREMRALRKALPDREQRSARIWANVRQLPELAAARSVMTFASVPGEPITGPFIEWCRELGKTVHLRKTSLLPTRRRSTS